VKKLSRIGRGAKRYLVRFFREEDGAELIQFAIVIAIAAVLAVAVMAISQVAGTKIEEAKDLIDGINIAGGSSGGGSSGP